MSDPISRIREVAPSANGDGYSNIRAQLTGESIGSLTILCHPDNEVLGVIELGGITDAELIVAKDGLSRVSGGKIYLPLALRLSDTEPR